LFFTNVRSLLDSEWDAAAIYGMWKMETGVLRLTCRDFALILDRVRFAAWAHLILYGEEATKLAQKEGEEAAAAYEQEKRDIAEGKIPEPQQKLDKKKKAPARKPKAKTEDELDTGGNSSGAEGDPDKKRKASSRDGHGTGKKARNTSKDPKTEKELLAMVLAKGVAKVSHLPTSFVFS
jgi:hypothetical protein